MRSLPCGAPAQRPPKRRPSSGSVCAARRTCNGEHAQCCVSWLGWLIYFLCLILSYLGLLSTMLHRKAAGGGISKGIRYQQRRRSAAHQRWNSSNSTRPLLSRSSWRKALPSFSCHAPDLCHEAGPAVTPGFWRHSPHCSPATAACEAVWHAPARSDKFHALQSSELNHPCTLWDDADHGGWVRGVHQKSIALIVMVIAPARPA
eukprot:SAG11_NODE_10310_length_840_cov_1.568151_2_plen_203_part_01